MTVRAVKAWLARNRWPVVEVEKELDGRRSVNNPYGIGPRVEIPQGLDDDEKLITLLHEAAHIWMGHYTLHDSVWPTREEHMIREAQAETIAMLCAEQLGRQDVKPLSLEFLDRLPEGLVDLERMNLIAKNMATQIERL